MLDLPGQMSWLLGLSTISMVILKIMDVFNPKPYMDEIFHIPQTQRYCNGSYWEWDPKITTLPGSYILPAITLKGMAYLGLSEGCTTFNLRAFNTFLGVMNFFVIYRILPNYVKLRSHFHHCMATLNTYMFPVLYFFNFFYYTDVMSTFCLLCMHCAFLENRDGVSAMFGAFAVFTRQTNIMFVGWHILLTLHCYYDGDIWVDSYWTQLKGYLKALPNALFDAKCHVLVGLSFLVFVAVNGSIVVGDKTAHQATPNVPQIGYFALVYGFFALPYLVYRFATMVDIIQDHPTGRRWGGFYMVLLAIVVYLNTVEHPYLLADNRHYTFYVWRRVFKSTTWLKYALIPFYMYVYSFIYSSICMKNMRFITFLIMCSIPTFCLQSLMEFRYFIPTFLYAHIIIHERSKWELIAEFFLYLSVNVFTFYMYLFKPFEWPGHPGEQRFMW